MGRVKKRRSTSLSTVFLRYILFMLVALLTLGICTIIIFPLDGEVLGGNLSEDAVETAWKMVNYREVSAKYLNMRCLIVE